MNIKELEQRIEQLEKDNAELKEKINWFCETFKIGYGSKYETLNEMFEKRNDPEPKPEKPKKRKRWSVSEWFDNLYA